MSDLAQDGAIIYIMCPACGHGGRFAGEHLIGKLGWQKPIKSVLRDLTCSRCGMKGDMTIKFERHDLSEARSQRHLSIHDDWPTWPRDLWDIEDASEGRIEAVCNLYSNTTAVEAMRQLFDVAPDRDRLGNAEPLSAIYPRYQAPVVRLGADGERELVSMEWGFATPKISKRTGKLLKPHAWNNARDEKVDRNNLWSESFQSRRCLVPASSFQESKGQNPATNVWFALRGETTDERPPFAFAGIWRYEQKEMRIDEANRDTHSIITTYANATVKPVHPNRMPVILKPEDYETWLTGSLVEAKALLRPYPAHEMWIVRQGENLWSDPLEPLSL